MLPHVLESLALRVDVCCSWRVAVGPHEVIFSDFAVRSIDLVINAEGHMHTIVELNDGYFRTETQDGVAGSIDLR